MHVTELVVRKAGGVFNKATDVYCCGQSSWVTVYSMSLGIVRFKTFMALSYIYSFSCALLPII